jgi:hypothetical protein
MCKFQTALYPVGLAVSTKKTKKKQYEINLNNLIKLSPVFVLYKILAT